VKAELAEQIGILSTLKRNVIKSEQVETSAKSRLRITIESLLIDLNEEIFALSEELAQSFSTDARALVSKAREFDHRKKQLIRRVTKTIDEDQVARIVNREFKIQIRSRSSSKSGESRSNSRSRSRSKPLRDRRPESRSALMAEAPHSPPEREKTTTAHRMIARFINNNDYIPPSYVDTEDQNTIVAGGVGGGP